MAYLYDSQGRYAETEPLYIQALGILVNTLPENHPYIQQGLSNFLGMLQQAIEAGQTDQLSDHPYTQQMLQHLLAAQAE